MHYQHRFLFINNLNKKTEETQTGFQQVDKIKIQGLFKDFPGPYQCLKGPIYTMSGISGTFKWFVINEAQIHFLMLLILTVPYLKNKGNKC